MFTPKFLFRILPWFILAVMVFTLYLTSHWPFGSSRPAEKETLEKTVILQQAESIGKLELVRYRFKEIFDYQKLSESKSWSSAILRTYDFTPDLKVVMIAAGEAVGCIDLQQLDSTSIEISGDSVIVMLPAPELCYYKLDLENTKVYSFDSKNWFSRLFSDDEEKTQVLEAAYRKAEQAIRDTALKSGILSRTNQNATSILKPMLEKLTGKQVFLVTTLPGGATHGPL